MKRKKTVLIGLMLALLLLVMPLAANADFGSYAGDSDYGGSSSSDWGSGSSDWGSGSSDWGSGSSDWGSGSSGYTSSDYDDNDGGGLGFGAVVVLIIIVLIVMGNMKRNKKRGASTPVMPGAQATPIQALKSIESYRELDPQFSATDFQEKMSNLYVQMQNCWQNKDISSIRPYLTDGLFEQMDRQLAAMKKAGRTNYVERIAVLGAIIKGYKQSDESDTIIVELRTRIVDYTKDDTTGQIVSGSDKKELFMTYEWQVVRPSGQITKEKGAMSEVNCPNCGAPLSMNQSAKCPYCDSVVTLTQHDWAIYAIKGLSQRSNG